MIFNLPLCDKFSAYGSDLCSAIDKICYINATFCSGNGFHDDNLIEKLIATEFCCYFFFLFFFFALCFFFFYFICCSVFSVFICVVLIQYCCKGWNQVSRTMPNTLTMIVQTMLIHLTCHLFLCLLAALKIWS